MCDYSLCGIPNRLAVEREELIAHRFRTGTIGLASLHEIQKAKADWLSRSLWSRVVDFLTMTPHDVAAVCIPPGARLIFKNIPKRICRQFGVQTTEIVRFTQTHFAQNAHRDAVQFSNGRCASLQELPPGISVEVLSLLPADLAEPASGYRASLDLAGYAKNVL